MSRATTEHFDQTRKSYVTANLSGADKEIISESMNETKMMQTTQDKRKDLVSSNDDNKDSQLSDYIQRQSSGQVEAYASQKQLPSQMKLQNQNILVRSVQSGIP